MGVVCMVAGIALFVACSIAVQAVHDDVLSAHRESHAHPEAADRFYQLMAKESNVARRGAILSWSFFGIALICLVTIAVTDRKSKSHNNIRISPDS